MKAKCCICENKIETNDLIAELDITIWDVRDGEATDSVDSSVFRKPICAWCTGKFHIVIDCAKERMIERGLIDKPKKKPRTNNGSKNG